MDRTTGKELSYWFFRQKGILVIITITGILYNVGMTAGPWFEGQMAQYLADIIKGIRSAGEMVRLALLYAAVIAFVQFCRFLKRLFVRKYANNLNLAMKETLYARLLRKSRKELTEGSTGALMTKAVSDVDACVEGMRKFLTEIFDTGVVMIAYLVMLFVYDWRLTLITCAFPPFACVLAEKLKGVVTRSTAAMKESAGTLNGATLDRVSGAVTYRIYGVEDTRSRIYEQSLTDYEHKAAAANLWENAMQPLYQVISMIGAFFILWLGGRNVLGRGWIAWNIAAFSTYLSCFTKLAVKSSHAAKLFNAVQKAAVSWKRIRVYMGNEERGENAENTRSEAADGEAADIKEKRSEPDNSRASDKAENDQNPVLSLSHVSVRSGNGREILRDVSFEVKRGEIIGVTGAVASGKSTFGLLFLDEEVHEGTVRRGTISYMGHDPELLDGTIEDNIRLGTEGDIWPFLKMVCLDREVESFPDGVKTVIGESGTRLSGGQMARVALARTLFHRADAYILDDPFSAVDQTTESAILENMRPYVRDAAVVLISHRVRHFPEFDRIVFIKDGQAHVTTHDRALCEEPEYRKIWELQSGGTDLDEKTGKTEEDDHQNRTEPDNDADGAKMHGPEEGERR